MAVERFPVEAGHIMLFARSIGDENPIYRDPEYAGRSEFGSIIAPPTFVQASAQFDPGSLLRPKPGEPWYGTSKTGSGVLQAAGADDRTAWLHAEQHFEYFRVLRPGDILSTTVRPGETWEKIGRRGGRLSFYESITEFRDQDGVVVTIARFVGVRIEQATDTGSGE